MFNCTVSPNRGRMSGVMMTQKPSAAEAEIAGREYAQYLIDNCGDTSVDVVVQELCAICAGSGVLQGKRYAQTSCKSCKGAGTLGAPMGMTVFAKGV